MKKETGKYFVPSGQKESDILPNLLHLTDKKDIDVAEFTGFFATQEFFIENLNSETVFD